MATKWKNPGDPSWDAETAINNAYANLAKKQLKSKKSGSNTAGKKNVASKTAKKK